MRRRNDEYGEVVYTARAVTCDEGDERVDGDRAHRLIGFDALRVVEGVILES